MQCEVTASGEFISPAIVLVATQHADGAIPQVCDTTAHSRYLITPRPRDLAIADTLNTLF
jgi:hypothetical protein